MHALIVYTVNPYGAELEIHSVVTAKDDDDVQRLVDLMERWQAVGKTARVVLCDSMECSESFVFTTERDKLLEEAEEAEYQRKIDAEDAEEECES